MPGAVWAGTGEASGHLSGPGNDASLSFFLRGANRQRNALHKEFGVSKSAISSTLKNLQEKGYLKERRHPEDDRKKQIILTDKAYALKAQLDQELAEQQACLCEGIPPQRLAALENELHSMLHNVRQQISRRTEP